MAVSSCAIGKADYLQHQWLITEHLRKVRITKRVIFSTRQQMNIMEDEQ